MFSLTFFFHNSQMIRINGEQVKYAGLNYWQKALKLENSKTSMKSCFPQLVTTKYKLCSILEFYIAYQCISHLITRF